MKRDSVLHALAVVQCGLDVAKACLRMKRPRREVLDALGSVQDCLAAAKKAARKLPKNGGRQ